MIMMIFTHVIDDDDDDVQKFTHENCTIPTIHKGRPRPSDDDDDDDYLGDGNEVMMISIDDV